MKSTARRASGARSCCLTATCASAATTPVCFDRVSPHASRAASAVLNVQDDQQVEIRLVVGIASRCGPEGDHYRTSLARQRLDADRSRRRPGRASPSTSSTRSRQRTPDQHVGRRTSVEDGGANALGGGDRVLVLPHTYDVPTATGQRIVGVPVTCDIGVELDCPPGAVGAGGGAVLGAPVPEAAVDEHRHLGRTENHIGASAPPGCGGAVETVAKSESVQPTTQRHLGCGVASGLAFHPVPHLCAGGGGSVHQMRANVVSYSLAIRTTMLA